jgi:hydroxymethylpyrimidine/phosphomethylpyrimidine kinase
LTSRPPRLLTIAGSDSSGGAGIQADIKTAIALGAYAMTAITAVTVQDTMGVRAVHPIPADIVRGQILACLQDIGADAIKIGMLGSAAVADTVAGVLRERAAGIAIVLDPVIASTGGTALLDKRGVEILRTQLIPIAALVTPNIPEAEALAGFECTLPSDVLRAGHALLAMGAKAVLIKGGHGTGDVLTDTLITPQGHQTFEARRIDTPHTHGTGCTYATAIAVGLARHLSVDDAVACAHAYVQAAIVGAPGLGRGHGPLDHMHALDQNK